MSSNYGIKISGLEGLIDRVKYLPNRIEVKKKEFLDKLSDLGVRVADIAFQGAQYDGDNDVRVGVEWISDNRLQVVASGNSVTFIEFGTGIHYTTQHPQADRLGFRRGEYGKKRGSRRVWGYYGNPGTHGIIRRDTERGTLVTTRGNPPARAMHLSHKSMRERIGEIAREVFTK